MILLLLADCSKANIAREYQFTEVGWGPQWRAETVGRLMKDSIVQADDIDGVERMVVTRYEVVEAVVEMVDTELMGVERFLAERTGIQKRSRRRASKFCAKIRITALKSEIHQRWNVKRVATTTGD